ncbi:hypothetical protein OG728_20875 [Streptomyces microflavus]|uniref:hypothetical protein n=1 Tax=Streptomyces microflavus TaxID=1919 RepID=UPI002E0F2F9A|nr:hypothetical protein OG728_20875 [Streptomyces microflavus]
MTASDRDGFENPFPLANNSRREVTKFGTVDVSSAIISITVKAKVNSITEARLVIDGKSSVISRLDFSSQITVEQSIGDYSRIMFTGFVVEAKVSGSQIEALCTAIPEFSERRLSPMATVGVPGAEMIYTLAKEGGLGDEQLSIQGIDTLPFEVFEIIAPVEGVQIDKAVRVGEVTIADREFLNLEGIPEANSAAEFNGFQSYAVTYVTSNMLLAAENLALQEIDISLAWLTVRSRYSIAPLPGGRISGWERARMFVAPRRGPLVYVRGLRTKRRWLRVPEQEVQLTNLEPTSKHLDLTHPPLGRTIPLNIRQAIIATARASREKDSITRVTALWEAIEFYVGKTAVPSLFSKSDKKAIRRALPEFADQHKSKRLEMLLGDLNNPPLFVKFRRRVSLDGAPVSQSDIDLLAKLRKVRNDVVHGRSPDEPEVHEVNQGVAIVSRILVFTVGRLGIAGQDV